MITTETFKYLTDWLVELIMPEYEESDIKKYVEGSHKPLKGIIAQLWGMFERHICEGKEKRLRYGDGSLFVYNGRFYESVEDSLFLDELVRRVLKSLGANDTYRFYGSPQIAKGVLNKLRLASECRYEPSRRWICFNNGVLDLKKREFTGKFNIEWCTDIVLDFDYNPLASNTLWSIKLRQIIPNAGFRSDFQQFCGSLLADRSVYKNEYVCYLHGGGGNGKSVLAAAIAGVLGPKYYSTFTLSQIFAKETASLFIIKEMGGKLLNWCDDVADKDVSGANFKRFVSGDPIQGRGVGKGDWAKITPPMLLCCINTFPDTSDDSEGNHRRQLIIETTRTKWEGSERDTQLTAKLSTVESRQAIFNWMLEGYGKFRNNGGDINLSKESSDARETRKALSSPMRRWAYDRAFVKAKPMGNADPRWHRLEELYADYKEYCINNGCKYEADSRKLSAMFASMGIEKKNLNGKGTALCIGVMGVDTGKDGGILVG